MNKEERFEKIVKWEKEPCTESIVAGILLLLQLTITIIFADMIYSVSTFIGVSYVVVSILSWFFGTGLILNGIGEGKKVYWKEVKE